MITQKKFLIAEQEFERELFGSFDENIKLIEDTLSIDVILREGNIVLMGEEKNVDLAYKLMTELQETVINGKSLDRQSVTYSLSLLLEGSEMMIKELDDVIVVTKKGKAVQPKTLGQKKYIELINQNDITFGIGPAGTGKTYLAVAMAVSAFKKDEVSRIVLTRPAVEAGESLGFLPGDLKDKVDPYLRPLYDALFDMLGGERVNKFLERGTIEVAPLAFMRGRTLDNAFIILDEAQNTTPEQMKMFLTRLGFGSKAVVTGDITQTDLPDKKRSGLVQATTILENIKGIGKIELTEKDVVRHELVQRIIKAYDKFEKREEYRKSKRENGMGQWKKQGYQIDDRQEKLEVSEELIEKIKDIILECLDYEDYDDNYEVSLSFVDNKEIHELNKEYRGIDRATDVLSFPLLVEDEFGVDFGEESLGDIVISLERAFEQSREYNHSFEREVCFLVCHSMFHLLGYDHDTEENTKEMRQKEEYILNKLGITRE